MAAVAKNPAFAKKVGIKPSVGEHFLTADKGKKFKEGGAMKSNMKMFEKASKDVEKKGMKEGSKADMALDKKQMMGMKKGGMAMFEKSGKDVEKKGMKEGSKADMALDKKQMMGMKKGGMANSDMAEDKPMMKKIAKEEVKAHEKSMHKMAKGGVTRADGCVSKGHTKGKMIAMKKGGAC